LIYVVALNILQDDHDFRLVLRCLLATLAIQCAIFIIQTVTGAAFTMTGEITRAMDGGEGLVRASGTVGTTPSGYAIFTEPLLFTSLALWRSTDLDMPRRRIGMLTALASATLILTLNRTSWITIILGSCIVEILCRRRGIARRLSQRTLMALGGVGFLGMLVIIPLILPRLEGAHEDDWNIRRNLMRIAIRMIAGNPIVGVGPGAYIYHLRQYAPGDVLSQWLWVVHNEYLLVWAERGIIGLIAWLAWMRAGFRQAIAATKTGTPEFRALGIGCAAALIGLCWEYTLNMYPPFCCYALWWCLFGILVAGNRIYTAAPASMGAELAPAGASAS
jgi:O-antigen ligase